MKRPAKEFPSRSEYLFPFRKPVSLGDMIGVTFCQNELGTISAVKIVLVDGTTVIPKWHQDTVTKFKRWIDELNRYQDFYFKYAISAKLEADE